MLLRPVVARLAEPTLWCGVLLALFAALPADDARDLAFVGGIFVAVRLVADVAPNLAVGASLEAAPYAERYIRRTLWRVKVALALFGTVVVLAIGALARHASGGEPQLALAGPAWLTGLPVVLSSYAAAAPIVLEHRGVPVARPSVGPTLGAAGFALGAPFVHATTNAFEPLVFLASISIVAGNLIGGGVQRYLAAARRIARPGYAFAQADSHPFDSDEHVEDRHLLRRVFAIAPFVLLPVAPALVDFFADPTLSPTITLVAMIAAGLPPILFDAKLRARRFRLAAYVFAAALGATCALWPHDLDAVRPLMGGAVLLLAYPAVNALLARAGARGTIVTLLVFYALAKAASIVFVPELPWPLAEAALAILAMAAALEE